MIVVNVLKDRVEVIQTEEMIVEVEEETMVIIGVITEVHSRDREMFSAVCDDCGKECKVPFKPSSDKPIYCSDCFEKRGGGNDKGGNSGSSKQLEEISEKLDRILKVLERKEEIKEEVKEEVKQEG